MTKWLDSLQPWGALLLRLVLAAAMLYNGWSKLIPANFHGNLLAPVQHWSHFVVSLGMPAWLGYISALTEVLGGIFILIGFLTRFAAFMIAINMLVALFKVNIHHGYTGSQYTISLIAISLMLLLYGSGALALDRRIGLN